MAHITTSQVQAWLENTKLTISTIDTNLEVQVAGDVIGRLTPTFSTQAPTWIDTSTTPEIVQQAIAMMYAGWTYDLKYAEVTPRGSTYGQTLRAWALALINDIILGNVSIAELGAASNAGAPSFYPTDQSSTIDAQMSNTDPDDLSIGPAFFSTGKVF